MLKRLKKDPTDMMNIRVGVLKGGSFRPAPEVEKPTYKVLGEIERVDQRDTAHSRIDVWKPGSKKYEDYYTNLHPEWKEMDDETKAMAATSSKRRQEKSEADRFLAQLELVGFYGASALSLPASVETRFRIREEPAANFDVTDENGKTVPLRMDPLEMSLKMKALGMQLGAAQVRITELNPAWVYSHTIEPWGKPADLNFKYVICMSVLQDPFLIGSGFQRSAHAFEVGFKYSYASLISIMMANMIRRLGWPARALPTFNAPYLVCPTFIDAGIGEDGRCGLVVSKEFGNNWRPAAVATDLPLVTDKPVDFGLQDFCDKCKICADTCPGGAIPKGERVKVRGVWKWQTDPIKCQRVWMKTGHDCAMCQKSCTWNHDNTLFHNFVREAAQRLKHLRKTIIALEQLFYPGNRKAGKDPRWMVEELLKMI